LNDDDGNHLAFDARGDRTTAEEKSSPHSKSLMISIILEIDDHPTLGKWPDWPKWNPSQSKRTRPPGAKLGGCGVASPTPPSTSLVFVTIIMGVHDVPTDAIQTQGFEAASGWPVPNCLSTERV
jgi:hypothetical protein